MNETVSGKPDRRRMKKNAPKPKKGEGAKKAKKVKKPKPVIEYYLPASTELKKPTLILGYGMRALLAALLSAGFTNFLCDSFNIIALNRPMTFLFAGVFAMLFAVMSISKLSYWISFGALLLALGTGVLISGDPVSLFTGMIPVTWNTAMISLEKAGFQSLMKMPVSIGGLDPNACMVAFQILLLLIVSVLVFVSVYRKVRMLPIVLCGVVTMLPVFTYNFAYSAIEFAVIILAAAGILVLRYYDRSLRKEKNLGKHKPALGGYMGFGAALLASVCVLIPAMTVKDQWDSIKGLNETMEMARTVLSAVLVGEQPDWSNMDSGGDMDNLGNRTTIATPRSYTGREVLKVYADINSPLYLRSWVALDYDDDTWSTANNEEREIYLKLFGESFDPEVITQNFYSITDPDVLDYSIGSDYANYMKYGFITTVVSVDVLNSTGNLIYVPARFDTKYGFLGFEGDDKAAGKKYSETIERYFDGVVTTGWLNFNKQYSTVSHLPVYRDSDFEVQLQSLKSKYDANMALIEVYYYDHVRKNGSMTAEEFMKEYSEYVVKDVNYQPFRDFAALPRKQQDAFIAQYVDQTELYENYVKSHYTETLDSELVKELARKILVERIEPKILAYVNEYNSTHSENDQIQGVGRVMRNHYSVMGVVEYLKDNYTYTLTPKAGTGDIMHRDYTAVDTFLFLTKEGYCVQFATAATFLLRELGVPVRYVEGYMVDKLEYDSSVDERFQKYQATVHDYNSHAWLEVYYEGIGWLTYEATAPYYDAIYKSLISNPIIPDHEPMETLPPETTPPEEEEIPEPQGPTLILGFLSPDMLVYIGIGAGALAVMIGIIVALRILYNRKKKRRMLHQKKIEDALNGELNQAEVDELGRYVSDLLLDACKAGGMKRNPKEYPTEYAARIDEALSELKKVPVLRSTFTRMVPLMEKVYFGKTLTREELTLLTEFWISLRDAILERYNIFERIWYHSIREKI